MNVQTGAAGTVATPAAWADRIGRGLMVLAAEENLRNVTFTRDSLTSLIGGSRCFRAAFVFDGIKSNDPCRSRIRQISTHFLTGPTPNANSRSAPKLSDAMISGSPSSSCQPISTSPFVYTRTSRRRIVVVGIRRTSTNGGRGEHFAVFAKQA